MKFYRDGKDFTIITKKSTIQLYSGKRHCFEKRYDRYYNPFLKKYVINIYYGGERIK